MNCPDAARPVTSETQRWSLTDAAQASWSLGRGQAEESRKTQSEIIQAIVSRRVRNRHQRDIEELITLTSSHRIYSAEKRCFKRLFRSRIAYRCRRRGDAPGLAEPRLGPVVSARPRGCAASAQAGCRVTAA